MKLDNDGDDTLKSLMGALCSIILTIVVLLYTYQKLDVFLAKKDVDILSTINDLHWTDDDIFSYENGLNIAVAFTAYDSEEKWILDETYGELIFNSYSWGPTEDGGFATERKLLDGHRCQRDELRLEPDQLQNARFQEKDKTSKGLVEAYWQKFLCLNKEEMYIYGDFNSEKTRQINIQLKKCHGRTDCKSDAEITAFFRNKYLLLLYN